MIGRGIPRSLLLPPARYFAGSLGGAIRCPECCLHSQSHSTAFLTRLSRHGNLYRTIWERLFKHSPIQVQSLNLCFHVMPDLHPSPACKVTAHIQELKKNIDDLRLDAGTGGIVVKLPRWVGAIWLVIKKTVKGHPSARIISHWSLSLHNAVWEPDGPLQEGWGWPNLGKAPSEL